MKNISMCLLLSVLLVQESKTSCEEWKKLESDCGSYCLKVLRPVLDHTKALQSQVNDFKYQTNSPNVIHKESDINYNGLEQKLEDLLKRMESNTKQNANAIEKLQNIELQFKKIDALQSKNSELLSKIKNIEQMQIEKLKIIETEFQKQNDNLKQSVKSLQERIDVLEIKLDSKLELIGKKVEITQHKNRKFSTIEPASEAKTAEVRKSFKKIGSKYYYIEDSSKVNWFDAADTCLKYGGHLASIQSSEEFSNLVKYLSDENYWIDINDLETEGSFVSATTGLKPAYLNWIKGEPNNLYNVEHCGEIKVKDNLHKMNDGNCDYKRLFICESENASFNNVI